MVVKIIMLHINLINCLCKVESELYVLWLYQKSINLLLQCFITFFQRNLTEYFNAVDKHNMMVIFASMLYERRIIFTSKKLKRLSACVQSANDIIYPMIWQHIFIPVLPMSLMDYLLAPMPFLIGVPEDVFKVKNFLVELFV